MNIWDLALLQILFKMSENIGRKGMKQWWAGLLLRGITVPFWVQLCNQRFSDKEKNCSDDLLCISLFHQFLFFLNGLFHHLVWHFPKKKRTDFCRQTVGISIFYGRGWNAGFLPVETEIHGAWNSLVAQTSSGLQGSQLGAQNGFQLSQTVLETLKAGSYDACDVWTSTWLTSHRLR